MADETQEEVIETTQGEELEESTEESVETTEDSQETKEDTTESKDDKIPVRSNASYIIERQRRTIEELRSKKDQGEEVDPVKERLDRIEQIALQQSDDRDLLELFEREPDARKYADKIKAYMEHDAYKGVSPEVIYHHLDYSESKAKKDSKRKAADLEANQTRSVGSGIRDTRSSDIKTAEDIRNMSMKEFAEYDRGLNRKS